jgi:hypothetical protein
VTQTTLPALNRNDSGTRLDYPQSQGIAQAETNSVVHLIFTSASFQPRTAEYPHIGLPLVLLDASGLSIPEWVAATMQMDLARSLFISGDWRTRSVNK